MKVTQDEYEDALKIIMKYHRQVTGKKESIGFYVDYIQPIKSFLNGGWKAKEMFKLKK